MRWKVGERGSQVPPPTESDGSVRRAEPPTVNEPTTQTYKSESVGAQVPQPTELDGSVRRAEPPTVKEPTTQINTTDRRPDPGRPPGRSKRKKMTPLENRPNRQDLEEIRDDPWAPLPPKRPPGKMTKTAPTTPSIMRNNYFRSFIAYDNLVSPFLPMNVMSDCRGERNKHSFTHTQTSKNSIH